MRKWPLSDAETFRGALSSYEAAGSGKQKREDLATSQAVKEVLRVYCGICKAVLIPQRQ